MSELKVNSLEYWNDRFQTNWEDFLGREQTTFFIDLLLKNLPTWLLNEIEDNKLTICDAGCAEGEGTYLLSKNFPKSDVKGIDFSSEAIKKAKEYYPEVEFIVGDINQIQEQYDVILCSNVLEHFEQPFDIIPNLIESAKNHVIIMIPFQEENRIKEHMYTFNYDSIPLEIQNYNLTYFKEIDCRFIEGTYWSGKQAILIYSNKEIVNTMELTLNTFFSDYNFHEKKYFLKENEVHDLQSELKIKEESINWYYQKLEEKDRIVQSLSLSLEKALGEIEKLNEYFIKEIESKNNIIEQLNKELEFEKDKILKQQEEIESHKYNVALVNQEISNMLNTKAWRLVNKYYNGVKSTRELKGHSKKFMYVAKTKGVKEAVSRSFSFFKNRNTKPTYYSDNQQVRNIYDELVTKYQDNEIKGIAIIPSAFEFDELYNQRTINLAKYLANEGYGVLYIAWQWQKGEDHSNSYKCFLDKIYQVPLYDFLETQMEPLVEIKEKHFIMTFPTEHFYKLIVPFREKGFYITYDIMDEWEEFYKVGEAPWYKQNIEEAIVLNSDLVVSVSEPLKEKFSSIRNDIIVLGNGYNENISKMKNISLRSLAEDQKIHIGYFGHLTSSWFDWELIFEILERKDIFIHIIGYGVDDATLNRLKSYPNIKFYGKVHPGELYEYVKNWHLGIIPFKKSKLSLAVDPIKIYEYLFFGLPTISTGIPHIGKYPLVDHCENTSEVLNAIDKRYSEVLNESLELQDIENFLENSTWENRFQFMMKSIKEKSFLQDLYEGESD